MHAARVDAGRDDNQRFDGHRRDLVEERRRAPAAAPQCGGIAHFIRRSHVRLPDPSCSRRADPIVSAEVGRRPGCVSCRRSTSSRGSSWCCARSTACANRAARSISARAQALQYLDAALGADRRQLFKQYVESLESAPKVSERIWQASLDLAQGFIDAYQNVLETALAPSAFGAGSRTSRSCSRASSTTTAPTRSFACAVTSAGFPPSGSSCTGRSCGRASSASSACRRRSAATTAAARSGRSSRNTSTRC